MYFLFEKQIVKNITVLNYGFSLYKMKMLFFGNRNYAVYRMP